MTKRFIGDYEANTGEFPFIHLLYETEETARTHPFGPLLYVPSTIDPFHSSTCPPLSFSTGALYSRKVTLEGEEVSLQIQDTPCVALQVTSGSTETAHRCRVSQLNSWIEMINVGGTEMLRKQCCQFG